MELETPQVDAAADEDGASENGGRNRSTIAFPYGSLKDAEDIAEALHRTWGGSAEPEQLAGSLNTTPRSGTHRTKVAATKIFGVIDVSRGKISLTPLGNRLVDPTSKDEARIEAFLTVPLFKAIFEAFNGQALPPDPGLEQKMADLGVSPKQTAKARQALQRSAERAGFFRTTKGRLIRPAATGHSGESDGNKGQEANVDLSSQVPAAPGVPLADLWLTLLNESGSWSAEKTQDFVKKARELREILSRES